LELEDGERNMVLAQTFSVSVTHPAALYSAPVADQLPCAACYTMRVCYLLSITDSCLGHQCCHSRTARRIFVGLHIRISLNSMSADIAIQPDGSLFVIPLFIASVLAQINLLQGILQMQFITMTAV